MPHDGVNESLPRTDGGGRFDRRSVLIGSVVSIMGGMVMAAWLIAHHTHEVAFGNWDARTYYGMASDLSSAMGRSLEEARILYRASFRSTHNAFYAAPIAVAMRFVGDSWLNYELLVALLYQWPASIGMGLLGASVATRRRLLAFSFTFGAMLVLPAIWWSTVKYYPDVAPLGVLSVMAILGWKSRERLSTPALGGIAIAAALAVLLRRHFVFPVVSLYVALGVVHLIEGCRGAVGIVALLRKVGLRAMKLAAAASGTLGILFLLAPRYTQQFFGNYSALYLAYRLSPGALLSSFAETAGWLITVLAIGGLVLAARTGLLPILAAAFLGSFAVAWAALWWFFAGYGGPQYVLHVFPMVQAIGFGLGTVALLDVQWKALRPMGVLVLLALASRFAVAPFSIDLPRGWPPSMLGWSLRPDRSHAGDAASYRMVVEELRRVAATGSPIYVAASSTLLSDPILKSADEKFPVTGGQRLNIITGQHIDSRDSIPLPELMMAEVVVVARPVQYHLAPADQRVVDGVVQLMSSASAYASAFTRRVIGIPFANGPFQVDIYVRDRPTSLPEANATLRALVAAIGKPSGGQGPWLLVSPTAKQMNGKNSPASSWISFESGPRRYRTEIMTLGEFSGTFKASARLRISGCQQATLSIGLMAPDGHVPTVKSFQLAPTAASVMESAEVPFSSTTPARLYVAVERPSTDTGPGCNVYFSDLSVLASPPP